MSMFERSADPIDGLPKRKYRVTFLPGNVQVEVEPDRLPYGDHGLPGSILDVAQGHDIRIEHACGGFGVCGTCHVIIREGADSCGEPTEEELDALYEFDNALMDEVPNVASGINQVSETLAAKEGVAEAIADLLD